MKSASFNVAAAVEIEPYACAAYKANRPKVQLLEKDIKKVTGKELLDIAGGNVDLLAGLEFSVQLPSPTHSKDGADGRLPSRTFEDCIGETPKPATLGEAKRQGPVREFDWHTVRDLSPANVKRLEAARVGKGWTATPEELRPQCRHHGEYRGFYNVYGRMAWGKPAPTITGGCTTFCKGRFGHPAEDRTTWVREAATLQTFPEDYCFDVPYMEHVCNVVGNALPCDFAAVVPRRCHRALAGGTP